MRQFNKNRMLTGLVPALVAGLVSAGCQQPSGQGNAWPPIPANPMSGPTRIPPPPTGSIGGGNSYTQPTPMNGQVSAGMRVNDLVAAAPVPQQTAAAPVGSGVLVAGNTGADSPSVTSSPIQQVGFETSNSPPRVSSHSQQSTVETAAPGLAPTIPAAAMAAPSYVDSSTPFRPQLRGMQAIDLTPTAPPTLQPVDSGNWAVVGENQSEKAAAFPSTQPIQGSPSGSAAEASLQWRRPRAAR